MKLLLVPALLLASSLFAADSDDFVPLFNARDLSGWVNANCAPETWSVTNGMIHCTGKPTGAMRTTRQYENFVLEAEWRHLSSGGNSGVFIWGTPIAAPGVPFLRGIEVQVLDHGYNANGKNQWFTTHGDVFPIHGATMKPFGRHNGQRSFPSEERSKPSPEWNHYRIVCTNGTIRLSVNGKEVSGGEDCNYRKGYLALESEGAPVEFRNIRIKEFPSNNPPADLVAPQDIGFRSIFTGLDLRGWKTSPATAASWAVEGERLRLKSGADGKATLWTEQQYKDAEFIVDIRRPKGASGAAPVFLFGGEKHAIIPLREDSLRPEYNRIKLTVKEGKITVEGNGDPFTVDLPAGAGPRGSFGLSANSSPLEFMNLYARENP
jgi:hypothetical protein